MAGFSAHESLRIILDVPVYKFGVYDFTIMIVPGKSEPCFLYASIYSIPQ
jgi:hypothetical protein